MGKSPRLANIELLRIIAMAMIVLLHCNSWMIGSVDQSAIASNPLGSFWRMLSQQICIVGANVFVMISGWFGIKATIKGGSNFLFQVIYHSIAILLLALIIGLDVNKTQVIQSLSLGSWNWFVPCYLGLFILSPILNAYINSASLKTQGRLIIVFLVFESLYGWLLHPDYFSKGYSIISFIGLYLIARYLRLTEDKWSKYKGWMFLALYVVLTIIPSTVSFFGQKFIGNSFSMIYYSSPIVIVASAAFFLAFTKMKIERGAKVINWAASSMFAVIMIHVHPIIVPYFRSFMKGVFAESSDFKYTCVAIAITLIILVVCVLADQLRKYTWDKLWNKCLSPFLKKLKFEV